MVASSNYATNFFLYVMTSSAFRKQLRDILCCYCCCKHQPTGDARSVRSGWNAMLSAGGRAAGGSNTSLAISNISTTRMTDVTEDGQSVTASEPNASPISENTRLWIKPGNSSGKIAWVFWQNLSIHVHCTCTFDTLWSIVVWILVRPTHHFQHAVSLGESERCIVRVSIYDL